MSDLTPELLDEIKRLLTKSDIRHGLAFRAMEQGLSAEQIAAQWSRTAVHARSIMRSVRYVLDGELPAGAHMAYTNSFAYRELWELGASDALMVYVRDCLQQLALRNPDVKVQRMGPVSFPGETSSRRPERPVSYCPICFLSQPCDCD